MSASYELLKRQLAEVCCAPASGTRASLTQAGAQTGQLEALRQQLREQLTDCGWREQLSERVRCPVQAHQPGPELTAQCVRSAASWFANVATRTSLSIS